MTFIYSGDTKSQPRYSGKTSEQKVGKMREEGRAPLHWLPGIAAFPPLSGRHFLSASCPGQSPGSAPLGRLLCRRISGSALQRARLLCERDCGHCQQPLLRGTVGASVTLKFEDRFIDYPSSGSKKDKYYHNFCHFCSCQHSESHFSRGNRLPQTFFVPCHLAIL